VVENEPAELLRRHLRPGGSVGLLDSGDDAVVSVRSAVIVSPPTSDSSHS
jgi:hypothetical protein